MILSIIYIALICVAIWLGIKLIDFLVDILSKALPYLVVVFVAVIIYSIFF